MINEKKINLFYDRLFQLAWNNEYINSKESKYIEAIRFSVDILNNYHLKIEKDLTAKRILFYKKSDIKIIKGRKLYECENNFKHKINIGTHYAMIHDGDNVHQGTRLCLPCAAKILIIILTNFPPTNDLITYTNPNINWETIEE